MNRRPRLWMSWMGWALLALALACGDAAEPEEAVAPLDPRAGAPPDLPVLEISVRDYGSFRVELFPHIAPKTVETFIRLANEGFYEGTTFHRVMPGFMIQGGDPLSRDRDPRNDGEGDPGFTVPDEFSNVSHLRGRVAMANRGGSDTGACQFYVTLADSPHLDGRYTVFGEVISGMEVVDAIAAVEIDIYGRWGPPNRPRENVVIESVRVVGEESAEAPAEEASSKAEPDPSGASPRKNTRSARTTRSPSASPDETGRTAQLKRAPWKSAP